MGDFAASANGSSICINSSLNCGLGGAGIGVNTSPSSTPAVVPSATHPAAGGGSGGPGGGSVAVPKHSTVVERLRQRIEGCRRHHVNCENRYHQAQAEQLELERRDTVSLYQRTLEQRAKKAGAGCGKQQQQQQLQQQQPPTKPQQDAEGPSSEQRNHTLIMVRAPGPPAWGARVGPGRVAGRWGARGASFGGSQWGVYVCGVTDGFGRLQPPGARQLFLRAQLPPPLPVLPKSGLSDLGIWERGGEEGGSRGSQSRLRGAEGAWGASEGEAGKVKFFIHPPPTSLCFEPWSGARPPGGTSQLSTARPQRPPCLTPWPGAGSESGVSVYVWGWGNCCRRSSGAGAARARPSRSFVNELWK